jgi:hypothetical protein
MKMAAKPANDGWQTVTDESATRIIFDTPGDVFIGEYLGHDLVQDEYDYVMFRGEDGALYSTSCGYKLRDSFGTADGEVDAKVAEGSTVRLTYVKDVPMGSGRNPMKDIRVDVKP